MADIASIIVRQFWVTSDVHHCTEGVKDGNSKQINGYAVASGMARYFFHIEGGHPHLDEVGEDHPHDAAAWQAALRLVRDIEDKLQPGQAWLLEVRNGN